MTPALRPGVREADAIVLAWQAGLDGHPGIAAQHLVGDERARDACRHQGVGGVHELEVKMRARRVAGVPDLADDLAELDILTLPHRHGTRRQVHEGDEQVVPSHDDVVAEDRGQSFGREREGVLHREGQLAQRMDPTSFLDAIDGTDDPAIKGRVDGRSPGIALASRYAEHQRPQPAGAMPMQPRPGVDPKEVEGIEPAAATVSLDTRSCRSATWRSARPVR